MNLRVDNHYVPKTYLKRWSSDCLKIWCYQILVSNNKVPYWTLKSIRSVANHKHLYTRISLGDETDEIECWLEREFETPAEEALEKATNNRHLKAEDWKRLIRFAAAQNIRTPAKLSSLMEKWKDEVPGLLNNTLQKVVKQLEEANRTGIYPKQNDNYIKDTFPLRLTKEPSSEDDKILLKAETLVGRSMWLYGIKHILTNTVNVLLQHKWSILHVVPGFEWVTSDDPVICLNYYKDHTYDFKGGWGNKGSEIIFPLSPQHLLYTKVGEKKPFRKELSIELCVSFQRMIIEHAHRLIFAKERIDEMNTLRPRKVNETLFKHEIDLWKNWHNEQSDAEKDYQ